MRRLTAQTPGFSLIELLITIGIIVLIAALVVPSLKDDREVRLIAASRILGSDLELAQVMTISDPLNPVVVRFVPSQGQYWLAHAASSDTPIKQPGNLRDYVVVFGEGLAEGAAGVTMQVSGLSSDTLTFNAHGGVDNLIANTSPAIRLIDGPRWIQLNISPITGTITETTEFTET
jgi:prepilin-type N-terminal cleavage/methylation domain-containing protein